MATKVFLASPGTSLDGFSSPTIVVEGVGAAIQSSFLVGLTVDLGTGNVAENGTTRAIKKSEVQMAIRLLEEFILKDMNSDFG